ncbi:MAG TPA: ATP-grasp domain-containing protein [Pyrinomonadaceae bacterium]|nr:ATP-grasp domain-containing protein [Pyrinomonadaceae bacterium]
MRECKRRGALVTLLTREATLGENWPRESIDEIIALPARSAPEIIIQTLSEIGRHRRIDRLVALEEYDVITAALAREHFCLGGMNGTTARNFRDKLAMRLAARRRGILVPDFVHALNGEAVADFLRRVPAPWMLKPRSDVSAVGIRKLLHHDDVWRAVVELDARENSAERASYFLLEQYLAGEVYHVDSLVRRGAVIFSAASRYGRPPIEVAHGGGVFLSSSIKRESAEEKQLLAVNVDVLAALGLENGAAHAEFIRREEDGRFYFLEVGARVGGAFLAEMIEAGTGVNLWREWAQIELASEEARIELSSPAEAQYSGIALSLARQEYPDTSAYVDAEIAYRVNKRYHVGLIVRSPHAERVEELLAAYAARFVDDFCAVLPPMQRPH